MEGAIRQRRVRSERNIFTWVLYFISILSIICVLLVIPLFYAAAPLQRYIISFLRPRNVCQYQIPMRYDFDAFLEDFSTKNRMFIESFRNISWQHELPSEDELKLVALFKTACTTASVYPRRACGLRVAVHPLCSAEISSLDIAIVKEWINFQKNIFVTIVKDDFVLLPINLVWIEAMPEPFRTYASAGAILADLLICNEDLSFEFPTFEILKDRLSFSNPNETSPSLWFPGKAEQIYWTFRLHSCCLKEGIEPKEYSELGYFRRLTTFVNFLRRIADSNRES